MVADGVEVEVEPGRAGGQAEGSQGGDELAQQLLAAVVVDTVGVAGEVGGLRQGCEAEEERQAGIVGEGA
jgi:hypothetical protein